MIYYKKIQYMYVQNSQCCSRLRLMVSSRPGLKGKKPRKIQSKKKTTTTTKNKQKKFKNLSHFACEGYSLPLYTRIA